MQFQLAHIFVRLPFFVLVEPLDDVIVVDDADFSQAKPVLAVDQPYVGALRGTQLELEIEQ